MGRDWNELCDSLFQSLSLKISQLTYTLSVNSSHAPAGTLGFRASLLASLA